MDSLVWGLPRVPRATTDPDQLDLFDNPPVCRPEAIGD
jgi:hypothetical protein